MMIGCIRIADDRSYSNGSVASRRSLIEPEFDSTLLQFDYLKYIIKRFRRQKTWANAFGVVFKGPGWSPGKPRLGNFEDLPDVSDLFSATSTWQQMPLCNVTERAS